MFPEPLTATQSQHVIAPSSGLKLRKMIFSSLFAPPFFSKHEYFHSNFKILPTGHVFLNTSDLLLRLAKFCCGGRNRFLCLKQNLCQCSCTLGKHTKTSSLKGTLICLYQFCRQFSQNVFLFFQVSA